MSLARGDAVQGTHHTAQTCSDMFTFIWFFRFIPRRYLRELLPVPERNETLVVLVPCAPPCEIRGLQPRTLESLELTAG